MSLPTAPRASHPASTRCRCIFDLPGKRSRLAELERLIADPGLWDDSRRAASLTQEAARLRDDIGAWDLLGRRGHDAKELAALLDTEADPDVETELGTEVSALETEVEAREVDLLFSDPYTDHAAILGIHAGAGGTDSQDWAEMLLRMYLRWAERHKFDV